MSFTLVIKLEGYVGYLAQALLFPVPSKAQGSLHFDLVL